MTIREASYVLGLKVRTIREWIKTGRLKAIKGSDNAWHIDEADVFSEEAIERAVKGRRHSRRVEEGIKMGMLQREGQDSEESI